MPHRSAQNTDETQLAREVREACDELSRRLRAGEECSAESLLAKSHAIRANTDAALELLYTEFVVHEELGKRPRPDDWYARFPQWRSELDELFEVHRFVNETGARLAADTPASASWDATLHDAAGPLVQGPRRLGNYEILNEIGRGGMGVVYRARQLSLNRIVALKMILAGEFAAPADQARFQREAEASAQLQHPNIVQTFEVGAVGRRPFLSMEFVEGTSLERQLAVSPMNGRSAAALIESIALAIDYAHQHGVIHRDLKPANVLLTPEGIPKVTDFGLAKQLDTGLPLDRNELTKSGTLLGTPEYMAPEQAAGRTDRIGPAADTYALGAILYEALTGRPPFHGETPLDTLDQVRSNEPLPPSRLQPQLARDLETICLKALSKQPTRRYETAKSLADDLRRFLNGEPILARRTGPVERAWRWCRRKPLVAVLAAALVLALNSGVAGIAWQWHRARAQALVAVQERDTANRERAEAERARQLSEAHLERIRELAEQLTWLNWRSNESEADRRSRHATMLAALETYRNSLQESSSDPPMRYEMVRIDTKIGNLLMELRQPARAIETLQAATGECDVLLAQHAASLTPLAHNEIAACYQAFGHALRAGRQFSEAAQAYNRAADLWNDLTESSQGLAAKLALSTTQACLSVVQRRMGNHDEADKLYDCALSVRRDYTNSLPPPRDTSSLTIRGRSDGHPALKRNVVRALVGSAMEWDRQSGLFADAIEEHAELLRAKQDLGAAEYALKYAIDLRADKRFNISPSVDEPLARAYGKLGDVLVVAKKPGESLEAYREAQRLTERCIAGSPLDLEPRETLAQTHLKLAKVLESMARSDEAIAAYERAIDALAKLTAESSGNSRNLEQLAAAQLDLGDLVRKAGDAAKAESCYRESLGTYRQLADLRTTDLRVRRELSRVHRRLGTLLAADRRSAEALEQYRLALEATPDSAAACSDVARQLANCPHTELREPDQAVQLAEKATALAPRVAYHWQTLGVALYRSGKWQAAIDALTRSQQLLNARTSFDWLFLAMAYWQIGDEARARQCHQLGVQWMQRRQIASSLSRVFRAAGVEFSDAHTEELDRASAEADSLLKPPAGAANKTDP
jgi:tetratricopeptide (TPR) repeat protein